MACRRQPRCTRWRRDGGRSRCTGICWRPSTAAAHERQRGSAAVWPRRRDRRCDGGLSRPQSGVLPHAGFAMVRSEDPLDRQSLALLKYGPHGGSHGHPDKLAVTLYARGVPAAADLGSQGYGIRLHRPVVPADGQPQHGAGQRPRPTPRYRQAASTSPPPMRVRVRVRRSNRANARTPRNHTPGRERPQPRRPTGAAPWWLPMPPPHGPVPPPACTTASPCAGRSPGARPTLSTVSTYTALPGGASTGSCTCTGRCGRYTGWRCRTGARPPCRGVLDGSTSSGDDPRKRTAPLDLTWSLRSGTLQVLLPDEEGTTITVGEAPSNPASERLHSLVRTRYARATTFVALIHPCDGPGGLTATLHRGARHTGTLEVTVGGRRDRWRLCAADSPHGPALTPLP